MARNQIEDPESINFEELKSFYGLKGHLGDLLLKWKLGRSWLLQSLAAVTPSSRMSVALHRARGVKIGNHVYIGPKVFIDTLYPTLVTIEDYVSIGMGTMIFAHSNPTNSILLKRKYFPRKVEPVVIKKGAWIAPGCIILCGVTIGSNSVVGAGSIVTRDVEDESVVAGSPARLIKRLTDLNGDGRYP